MNATPVFRLSYAEINEKEMRQMMPPSVYMIGEYKLKTGVWSRPVNAWKSARRFANPL